MIEALFGGIVVEIGGRKTYAAWTAHEMTLHHQLPDSSTHGWRLDWKGHRLLLHPDFGLIERAVRAVNVVMTRTTGRIAPDSSFHGLGRVEIAAEFRRRAKLLHPDSGGSGDGEALAALVTERDSALAAAAA